MAAMDRAAYMAELVAKAQQKDSDAFAELYILTYQAQYKFARKYLRDDYLAQDAVQEVYILVLKNIHKLKTPGFFGSWLSRINYRVCYDIAEKFRPNLWCGDDELAVVADEVPEDNPERMMETWADREELREALSRLPIKERNAIELKYMAEMNLKDISEVMECSVSSVTRYLSQGYQDLRNLLK